MAWQQYLDSEQARFVQELLAFVRIRSVSAKPENIPDVVRAAEWVAQRLTAAGVEAAEVLPTDGHPVVCGHWLHAGGDKPTILIYGHFDVQPPEPLEAWDSPPFQPTIRNGRIYGRGSADNKGQFFAHFKAIESILKV
ncbi:MAG: M20/M25/M40 family metallo-hydrolase, partial [Cypionkella sp.]|nr:M20/M25/M40 family metallo-hydrolase [Cypionkella sp.]